MCSVSILKQQYLAGTILPHFNFLTEYILVEALSSCLTFKKWINKTDFLSLVGLCFVLFFWLVLFPSKTWSNFTSCAVFWQGRVNTQATRIRYHGIIKPLKWLKAWISYTYQSNSVNKTQKADTISSNGLKIVTRNIW